MDLNAEQLQTMADQLNAELEWRRGQKNQYVYAAFNEQNKIDHVQEQLGNVERSISQARQQEAKEEVPADGLTDEQYNELQKVASKYDERAAEPEVVDTAVEESQDANNAPVATAAVSESAQPVDAGAEHE